MYVTARSHGQLLYNNNSLSKLDFKIEFCFLNTIALDICAIKRNHWMNAHTIGVFTFNTNGTLYGCKKNPHGVIRKFTQYLYNNDVVNVDFTMELKKRFEGVDVIVIGLQESSIKNPKTFMRSDQLLQIFAQDIQDDYYLLFKNKQTGIGEKGIRGLRLGVYVKNTIPQSNTYCEYISYSPLNASELTSTEGQHYGKGSIGIKLTINNSSYTVINSHFPFHGDLPDQGKSIRNIVFRETMDFFSLNKFLDNPYIFAGDLNYRIEIPLLVSDDDTITKKEFDICFSPERIKATYCDCDTLKLLLNNNDFLPTNLKEGANNNGISFMPTSKLFKYPGRGQSFENYKIMKSGQKRIPSWTDRILYNCLDCIEYDKIDFGNISMSDHAGVIGIFRSISH